MQRNMHVCDVLKYAIIPAVEREVAVIVMA